MKLTSNVMCVCYVMCRLVHPRCCPAGWSLELCPLVQPHSPASKQARGCATWTAITSTHCCCVVSYLRWPDFLNPHDNITLKIFVYALRNSSFGLSF